MIAIRAEIDECPDVLRNAPHTAAMRDWPTSGRTPYTREQAAYPVPAPAPAEVLAAGPPHRRRHGDRNLICACPPVEAYA